MYQHFNSMPYELKIFKKNLIKWQSAGRRLIFNTDVLELT